MSAWPVAITPDGNVASGAILWRLQRRLQLTVLVKASFSFSPEGRVTRLAPVPIVTEDRTFGQHPSRSVEAASELAPHLARCDVTLVGHAYANGGLPVPASAVRLGISRDGRPLLDKTQHVFGDRGADGAPTPFAKMPLVYERAFGGAGEANPLGIPQPNLVDPEDARRPAGFGPISRFWPSRKRLLGAIDRHVLEGPIAEIPDAMPWAYFQAAPPDQQIEHLRGDEWLVLDGMHPSLPRLQAQLPGARGAAHVRIEGAGPAEGTAIALCCDTLSIDADRQVFSLVWRGRFEVLGGEPQIALLRVLTGLEMPDAPVNWAQLAAERSAPASASVARPSSPRRGTPAAGEETMMAQPGDEHASHRPLATPFAQVAPMNASPSSARPTSLEATPWSQQPLRTAPAPVVGEQTLSPRGGKTTMAVGEGTMALDTTPQSARSHQAITPFALSPNTAPPSNPAPAAPFRGLPTPVPASVLQPGEATLTLSHTVPSPPAPVQRPLPTPRDIESPPDRVGNQDTSSWREREPRRDIESPRSIESSPYIEAPAPTPPRAPTTQARAVPTPAPKPAGPEALAERFKGAGAASEDIAALLRALKPPPPPPPPEGSE